MAMFFRSQKGEHAYEAAYGAALKRLLPYFASFFVAVMAIYVVATKAGLSEWLVAVIELALALVLIGFIFVRRGDDVGPVLRNRDLMLLNFGMIAVLWNLWFFGFWSVSIVKDATHGGFWGSALTATFWGVAGILGFPAGGWLADRDKKRGTGRKPKPVMFSFIQGAITIGFGLTARPAATACGRWACSCSLRACSSTRCSRWRTRWSPTWCRSRATSAPRSA